MTATPWLLPDWPVPACVRALTTLRHGLGVSPPPFDHLNLGFAVGGDQSANVEANRRLLQESARLPDAPRWLRQVHGTGVLRFSRDDLRAGDHGVPEADAAVTSDAGVVLAVLTADCLPVLLASEDGQELAAAHAGWRGLAAGVLEASVRAMRTPPSRILAWLGPAAGANAYEVGEEVRAAFLAGDPGAESAFRGTRPGHWHVDLCALARQRLLGCGVGRVYGGQHCTISEGDRFFSHRRDGRCGRMATLIWREA